MDIFMDNSLCAFHEKALLVKRVHGRCESRLRAILPSALLVSLSFGSVHFEVRRGLALPSTKRPRREQIPDGQRDRPQSPGPGGQAKSSSLRDHTISYAAVISSLGNPCNGSYASPDFNMLNNITASLRATATLARFLAFLPPREQIRLPLRRKSLS